MLEEHNDQGGGHSSVQYDVATDTFSPDVSARPERGFRPPGALIFAAILAFLGWKFISGARAPA